MYTTGFLSQLGAKLRDWAVRPVRAGCYSWAALSFIDSETLYKGCEIRPETDGLTFFWLPQNHTI